MEERRNTVEKCSRTKLGACNPPTDPGRVPLTHRFLRYVPLILVDFPSEPSLHQVCGLMVFTGSKNIFLIGT